MARLRRVVFGIAAVLVSSSLSAATLTVDLNGGAGYTDIQSAIDAAKDGDTVLVKPGEYVITEPIDFNRLHDPDDPASPPVKNIVVRSEGGAEMTTIRMSGTPANLERASVAVFENGEGVESRLEGFTLTGGKGIWNPSMGPPEGGSVFCSGSSPTLSNCTITGNSAVGHGGGVYCDGGSSPTLTNCTISGNSAGEGGGVDCIFSSPTLTNCTISGNSAVSGSGVSCDGSSPTLTSCIVWDNPGGSLIVVGDNSQANVSFSCLETEALWPGEGNINADPLFCGWGERGEVWADPSKPGPGDGSQGSPFSNPRQATTYSLALSAGSPCIGSGKGGANMGADTGRCDGPTGKARIVHLAPGTYRAGDLELAHKVSLLGSGEDTTVIEGTVVGLRTGSSLSNLTVTRGTEGGIVVSAGESPETTKCTISGNSDGSGVYCGGNSSPKLTNCTISGNSAPGGGGVYCGGNSSPIITNCTISGNSANEGGGVCCALDSSPTLTNCTISGNSAEYGGGVYCWGSSPFLTSCIVWYNPGGSLFVDDKSQPNVSFSCLETEALWPGEGNISADPLFCGWGGMAEAYVDGSHPGSGDGNKDNPFSNLASALSYSLALSAQSPCIGSGLGRTNMGADTGVCGPPGESKRLIHVASGTYGLLGKTLAHSVSIEGEGETETVLEGTVFGLRTGTVLSRLKVTGGKLGGIAVSSGEKPEILHCTISGNTGSGVLCGDDASPSLTDCTISGNTAEEGGGLCCSGSPIVTNCVISGNAVISIFGGGGVSCVGERCFPTFTNCTITGNSDQGDLVSGGGGGVFCLYSSPIFNNCTISENSVLGGAGGGVWCGDSSSPTLTNCTITGNNSLIWGGAVFCGWGASAMIANCTITANSGPETGGVCCFGSSPTLKNCIVWGKAAVINKGGKCRASRL